MLELSELVNRCKNKSGLVAITCHFITTLQLAGAVIDKVFC